MAKNDRQPNSSAEWLCDIESRFVADDAVPHVDYRDRIRLWKAMDIEHGVGSADCRRAVLAARYVWPLIDDWEKKAIDNSQFLPKRYDYLLPREFLQISTKIFLKEIPPLEGINLDLYCAKVDNMWLGELEPESLIPLAVTNASLLLVYARLDAVDQGDDEFWQEVLENGYTDLSIDSCDWEGRDTFHWVFWAQIGKVDTDEKRDKRINFWRRWLRDVVDVNTRPPSDLNSELRSGLQKQ